MAKRGPKGSIRAYLPKRRPPCKWWHEVTGLQLYRWQHELLSTLHDYKGEGRPKAAYVQVPRKNGKTFLAAAVGLTEICLKQNRHVYCISDSERNLQAALFREIKGVISGTPELRNSIHVYQRKIEVPETNSFLEILPSKFEATQSINPHLVLFDEVHLQRSMEIWAGMQMAGAARADSMLLGITTPGHDMLSPALEFYERVQAGDMWGRIYEAAPGRDIDDEEGWWEANPAAGYIDGFVEAMEHDRKTLPEHEFKRFRLGQWTATAEAWLPYGAWGKCHDPLAVIERDTPVVLGFDGSFSRDATALVGATIEERPYLFVVQVWEKPRHANVSWRVPRQEVTDAVMQACERMAVRELAADVSLWVSEMEGWEKAGVPVVEYPQSATRMKPATSRFYEAVTTGLLRHDGNDALERHLNAAIIRPNGMIAKEDKDSPRKIDAAVAGIMAYDRAAILGAVRPRGRVYVG